MKVDERASCVARMTAMMYAYKILVRKLEGKWPFGKPKRRWEGIKMYLVETGCKDADWINIALNVIEWQALVNAVMDFWIL
jgi:hypothetical protein